MCLIPPHAVQGPDEVVLVELVLVPQQGTLLQRHGHGRPVFGTFTASEADAIQPPAYLTRQSTPLSNLELGHFIPGLILLVPLSTTALYFALISGYCSQGFIAPVDIQSLFGLLNVLHDCRRV